MLGVGHGGRSGNHVPSSSAGRIRRLTVEYSQEFGNFLHLVPMGSIGFCDGHALCAFSRQERGASRTDGKGLLARNFFEPLS